MRARAVFVGAVLLAPLLVSGAGCNTDPYCLDCVRGDGGAGGDGGVDGAGGDGATPIDGGGGSADACALTGVEICDGVDNDCNGLRDDNLTDVGGPCQEELPLPCTSGVFECVDGERVCGGGAVVPRAETCNGVDDDCDGTLDDGDPGGGMICGIALGDCQQGITRCVDDGMGGKIVDCVGDIEPAAAETCDNHDNDCDGMIDEGNPGGGASCGLGMGICVPGTMTCIGGALQCVGASPPTLEICDLLDNDCDGMTDEDFDLQTDRRNCGMCGNVCTAPHAIMGCQTGGCVIVGCETDWWDDPAMPGVDCSLNCQFAGAEVCNGADDDCDGTPDDGVVAPAICLVAGECAGTTASCAGAGGWVCDYPATVSVDMMGDIIPEADCDGRDNDCDGESDEAFPTLGDPCTDSGMGVCQGRGELVCNATMNGTLCNITMPGMSSSSEICDGKDNDCDGTPDDGATDNWVQISVPSVGTRWIYKYEASRPDATTASQGTQSGRSCSNPSVLPWTNVTHPQATAACTAAGGRLCTEAEWQASCRSTTNTCNWGMTSCTAYTAATCNGNDYDFDSGMSGDQDGLLRTMFLASCYANWGSMVNRIFDLSGNAKEWVQAAAGDPANSARLRGGSYNNTSGGMRCDFRFAVGDDTFQFPNVGFRCCRSTAP